MILAGLVGLAVQVFTPVQNAVLPAVVLGMFAALLVPKGCGPRTQV